MQLPIRSASQPAARPEPAGGYAVAIIAGSGLVVAALLGALVARTRLGMLIRAGASNRTMVAALGVNIRLLYTVVFGLGAALAGLAGLMAGPIYAVQPGMGEQILITTFVVVVIGGLGSLEGAFIGAALVSFVRTAGVQYCPEVELAVLYLIAAVVLLFRPTGLFGKAQ